VGERERGRSDSVRGAFTGDGEAVKSAGSEEALRHPLELDEVTFWAWRRGAIGGDGCGVVWWCSQGLYIGPSMGRGGGPARETAGGSGLLYCTGFGERRRGGRRVMEAAPTWERCGQW
jgi:hypothetical protein